MVLFTSLLDGGDVIQEQRKPQQWTSHSRTLTLYVIKLKIQGFEKVYVCVMILRNVDRFTLIFFFIGTLIVKLENRSKTLLIKHLEHERP